MHNQDLTETMKKTRKQIEELKEFNNVEQNGTIQGEVKGEGTEEVVECTAVIQFDAKGALEGKVNACIGQIYQLQETNKILTGKLRGYEDGCTCGFRGGSGGMKMIADQLRRSFPDSHNKLLLVRDRITERRIQDVQRRNLGNPRWSTSCYDIHRSNNHNKIDNDHNNNNNNVNNNNNNTNNKNNNYHTANIFDVEPMESVV